MILFVFVFDVVIVVGWKRLKKDVWTLEFVVTFFVGQMNFSNNSKTNCKPFQPFFPPNLKSHPPFSIITNYNPISRTLITHFPYINLNM